MAPCGRRVRTATIALLVSLPGTALTLAAAVMTRSMVLWVDALLSLLDSMALLAVLLAVGARADDPERARVRELHVRLITSLAMLCAMATLIVSASLKLSAGGPPPQGPGLALGISLNVVQAMVNGALLLSWRRRDAERRSAVTVDQLCLFTDKLFSNLLVILSLAGCGVFSDKDWASYIDPMAGIAIALVSACCAAPVVARAWSSRGDLLPRASESPAS